jgi:ATP-dependent exoDNAse (exonuclease V) beta subunit
MRITSLMANTIPASMAPHFEMAHFMIYLPCIYPSWLRSWLVKMYYRFLMLHSRAREAAFKFLDKFEQGKIFKKCPAEVSDGFYHHPLIQQWVEIIRHLGIIQDQLEQLQQYLKAYLCLEVKQRLPQLLQQKGETTFSQQIRTLAEALQGEQGQRFAIFVQARYPLILVDEFQDTNQDQDDMLASIWRHPQRYQKGCMIMVGDRKQAIYGFRGGDMLTFLKAHQDIKAKQGREYQARFNHRSVKSWWKLLIISFNSNLILANRLFMTRFRQARVHILLDRSRSAQCCTFTLVDAE